MPDPPDLPVLPPEQPVAMHFWHAAVNAVFTLFNRSPYPETVKPGCPCPYCVGHQIGRYEGWHQRDIDQKVKDVLTGGLRNMKLQHAAQGLQLASRANHETFCDLTDDMTEHSARMTFDTAQDLAKRLAELPPELKRALLAAMNAGETTEP